MTRSILGVIEALNMVVFSRGRSAIVEAIDTIQRDLNKALFGVAHVYVNAPYLIIAQHVWCGGCCGVLHHFAHMCS